MKVKSSLHIGDAACNIHDKISSGSVHLVVTSPPYPMIEMWDKSFMESDPAIRKDKEDGATLDFYLGMLRQLRRVWMHLYDILVPGGIVCINIGDATRTVDGKFALYPNQALTTNLFFNLGFTCLPPIIWRKPTNRPNKFLGSGMLPGAYVTHEKEYILIFRKGDKRGYSEAEKVRRRESAFFWGERNVWFSDIWEVRGERQKLNKSCGRERSGAYPLEIPMRLINMYSIQGDTVLDPFVGTGTTLLASCITGRDSIGIDSEPGMVPVVRARFDSAPSIGARIVADRIHSHAFLTSEEKGKYKHRNENYNLAVRTKQEKDIKFFELDKIAEIASGPDKFSWVGSDSDTKALGTTD